MSNDQGNEQGVTASERYLAWLGRNTFLSPWCFANLYTDEGKKTENGDGKELCDLFVVFKEHVIIFSDKDIAFKDTGNLELDWSRWVRKAVLRSAPQVFGAEKFIREHAERIFLDRKCTQPFPIAFPPNDEIKIHRVLVARNATERFRKHTSGSGSLMLNPTVVGKEMEKTPFQVGTVNPQKGFVHVLDDVALDTLMRELDTVHDFTTYLSDKEALISSGRLGISAGEEDLLGYYLSESNKDRDPGFYAQDVDLIVVQEGIYDSIRSLPQYKRGKELDASSYFIDRFIEYFGNHARDNTWHFSNAEDFDSVTLGIREFASESRVGRRVLADAILEKLKSLKPHQRGVRLLLSPTNPETMYVWLIVPVSVRFESYQKYREFRAGLLFAYCQSAKLLKPERRIVVGVGTDPPGSNGGSEDMIYIDTASWSEDDYAEAQDVREKLSLFKEGNVREEKRRQYQYPVEKTSGDDGTKRQKEKERKHKRKKQKDARRKGPAGVDQNREVV
ncbi:hypothetical protein E0Z06_06500 [Rheinheimera sp. D18]|uniref:hypothetical protein n=1 Tax=Rheinheimera sp. D18 TaxID=2545632 RepID=UPI00104D6E50|nr:hypothetical protein [Rheinheimera sp. D18]QBL09187.1 hypothetical protein E0Z06_06500 [Rheinheimera sp. D18]